MGIADTAKALRAQMNPQSPTEIVQQQERWDKERVETRKAAHQGQLAHAALMLLASANGHAYDASTALKTAHEVLQGAKTYNP